MSPSLSQIKLLTALCLCLAFSMAAHSLPAVKADPTPHKHLSLEEARKQSEDNPSDAALKYQYAEALRKAGKTQAAAKEFLAVTEIDASYYIAYHQLSLCSPDSQTLSDATKRLTYLMAEKPKEMMLRVALSELLECQGEYFQASKVLVDLVYQNAVPTKYDAKVKNRIRLLQIKARESYVKRKEYEVGDKGDTAPLPLPEESLARGLSLSRLEKASEVDGYGHSLLQH